MMAHFGIDQDARDQERGPQKEGACQDVLEVKPERGGWDVTRGGTTRIWVEWVELAGDEEEEEQRGN